MKRIILIAMIILVISSWYFVIANGNQNHEDYNRYINTANQYISKKIYVDAVECYKKAIEIYPNILENKLYLANIYKDAKLYNSFESYCIELSNEYKRNEKIIGLLGDYYVEVGKEEKAISLYKSYLLEYKDEETIADKLNNLKSAFNIDYKIYTDISSFHNGYAVFKKANKYGIMNNNGDVVAKAIYDYAGVYNKTNSIKLAPVLLEGEYFYIDLEGNRRLVADIKYDYLGSFSKNGYAVFKRNNFYGYLDKDLNEFDSKYDYASSFYDSNIAVVKTNNKWFLINENFEKINNEQYDDIKIDDLGCAVRSNIIFAKQNGKYMIIDTKGNKITEPLFDDVDFFVTVNEYAAVKIDVKWGFVDHEGKIVIEPKYDNAYSFSCGLAPVLIKDKWGYIDETENFVISPQFNMAKSFNTFGIAPVLNSEWQTLQLKYYEKGAN